jgi:hypothetical protein
LPGAINRTDGSRWITATVRKSIAFEIPAIPRTLPAMIHEKGSRLLDRMEHRFGRLALPKLLHWIAGFQAVSFALSILSPDFLAWIVYDADLILHGQAWRLVSWIFFPSSLNPLFFLFATMFTLYVSNSLEQEWGGFRVNLYVFCTTICLALVGFLPFTQGIGSLYGWIFFTTMFLAFATLFPDATINLFGIIPVKAKWLAVADVLYLVAIVLQAPTPLVAGVVVTSGLLPYLVSFGPGFSESFRRSSEARVRRHRFEEASRTDDTFHRCESCGATEASHPAREFRVAVDGNVYCDACRKAS